MAKILICQLIAYLIFFSPLNALAQEENEGEKLILERKSDEWNIFKKELMESKFIRSDISLSYTLLKEDYDNSNTAFNDWFEDRFASNLINEYRKERNGLILTSLSFLLLTTIGEVLYRVDFKYDDKESAENVEAAGACMTFLFIPPLAVSTLLLLINLDKLSRWDTLKERAKIYFEYEPESKTTMLMYEHKY